LKEIHFQKLKEIHFQKLKEIHFQKLKEIHFQLQFCACEIFGTNSDAQNTCAGMEQKWQKIIFKNQVYGC